MKTKNIILAAILAASSALQTAVAENKLPAPKPEFKTQEELVKWSEEKTKEAAAADSASAIRDSQFFYTGKPYLEESGTYAFRFRSYDPELARWTSADPSGFPDGANNGIYTSSPLSTFDPNGLANKSVVWISCYYDASNPNEYGIYLSVVGVTNMWRHNAQVYDRNSAATPDPGDNTHYLDDGDTFSSSSIGALSDLSAFSNYTQIYIFAHGIFDTSVEGNPFLGFGVGGSIYQASDFYNIGSNIIWVMGCAVYNNGDGDQTTSSIANNFITPTLQHLYE